MKKTLIFVSAILVSPLVAQNVFDIDFSEFATEKNFVQQAQDKFTRNGDGSDLIVQEEDVCVLRLEVNAEMETPSVVIQTKDHVFGPFTGKIKASVNICPGPGIHLIGFYESRAEALRRAMVKFESSEIVVLGEQETGGVIGTFEEGKWYRVEFEIEAGRQASGSTFYNVQVFDLQDDMLVAGTSANVLAAGNPESISGGVLQTAIGREEVARADFSHWKIQPQQTEE